MKKVSKSIIIILCVILLVSNWTVLLNSKASGLGTRGDIDGSGTVNSLDLVYFNRALAGWKDYSLPSLYVGDLDDDDFITSKDIAVLARHLANWQDYKTLP